MKTLAIETSCDDTSLAIVSYKDWFFDIEKILLHSQIAEHTKFGWVIPELASRLHEQKVIELVDKIGLEEIKKVDFISYTCCPGLPWSLLVGKTLANTLSLFLDKKLTPVHHINWHILSILCDENINNIQFPFIALTVSGWHNNLYIIENIKEETWKSNNHPELVSGSEKWWNTKINSVWQNEIISKYIEQLQTNYSLDQDDIITKIWNLKITKIWFTLDDAAGEVFDKVSRMLWWPYPGWKRIWDKAKKYLGHPELVSGSENWWDTEINSVWQNKKQQIISPNISQNFQISFPRIWLKKREFNFSFSGLKASANYKIQEIKKEIWEELDEQTICSIAYEFEQAVVETLWKKLLKAAKHFRIENIALVGGVSANEELKTFITSHKEKFWVKNFYTPKKNLYSTDNAAMIWVAGIIENLDIKE